MVKKVWIWIAAAIAALSGVLFLFLTGRRRMPPTLPPPPARPETPPVDKPLVALRPADDYEGSKAQPVSHPKVVISRINQRYE